MFKTPEQLASANQANVDTFVNLANTLLVSTERLAALNLNTARSILEEGVAQANKLFGAKDPQELMKMQTTFSNPVVENAVAYSRSVAELFSETQAEINKVMASQFGEVGKTMGCAFERAVKKG